MRRDFPQQQSKKPFTRVNLNIRVPSVRVVRDGEQLGVMPTNRAQQLADEAGLDLIEVVPNATPPVCHIADYGEYKYRQKIAEKEQARKQRETQVETKEVRFRPGTDDHDIETKVKTVRRFLEEKKKVQVNVDYKWRELSHKEEGFKVINQVIEAVADVGVVEVRPKLEGKRLTARLTFKVEK
jgi:translation initiation factor IF-3